MKKKSMLTLLGSTIALSVLYLQNPIFGRIPRKERKKKILESKNYYNGQFNNIENTM